MTVDLTTNYLGLKLRNPLVVSACPLTGRLDTLDKLQEAGAGAVVLPSLFEEQIEHEELEIHALDQFGAESFPEALSYFPDLNDYNAGPDSYLRHIEDAKQRLSIPVIASLNGTSPGGWVRYARLMQDAGADALELNVYFLATDPDRTAADVEGQYLELVGRVSEAISIPLSVKVAPYFSSLPNMARRLVEAGADGLVLFNRFVQPDINLDTMQVDSQLVLSNSTELRLPLRWIAILHGRIAASLAGTSGVHYYADAVKLLLAGADVAMTASALLQQGPGYLRSMLEAVSIWLEENEYDSVEQMKGSMSQQHSPNPSEFERANYMKALASYTGPFI